MKKFLFLLFSIMFTLGFSQDNCAAAVTFTVGSNVTVGTINGTPETLMCGVPNGSTQSAAEWYKFVASATGMVTVTTDLPINDGTTGSDDTRFVVYSGDCSSLVCVASGDDISSSNYLTTVSFGVQAGTTYTIAFDNRWSSSGFDFTSSFVPVDCSTSFPYSETFNNDGEFFACHKQFDNNASGTSWIRQDLDLNGDTVNENFATNGSGANAEDAWLITPAFTFTAGNEYVITYKYNGADNTANSRPANESLLVKVLNGPTPTSTVLSTVGTHTGIVQTGAFAALETSATISTATYAPATSGTYHVAFQVNSPAANGWLLLFEYSITEQLGVEDINADQTQLSIYPNPVKESFQVRISDAYNTAKTILTITDLSGKVVKTLPYSESYMVSDLAKGVYMLTITDGTQSESKKMIKE